MNVTQGSLLKTKCTISVAEKTEFCISFSIIKNNEYVILLEKIGFCKYVLLYNNKKFIYDHNNAQFFGFFPFETVKS